MRLTLPLTGTVLVEGSVWGDGRLSGDPQDPIRPIGIGLTNVSWQMVDVDLENEVMVIEIKPAEMIEEDTGEVDGEGNPVYRARATTQAEKVGFLQHAKDLIEGHSKEELYTMAKCPKLKRPFKVGG